MSSRVKFAQNFKNWRNYENMHLHFRTWENNLKINLIQIFNNWYKMCQLHEYVHIFLFTKSWKKVTKIDILLLTINFDHSVKYQNDVYTSFFSSSVISTSPFFGQRYNKIKIFSSTVYRTYAKGLSWWLRRFGEGQ